MATLTIRNVPDSTRNALKLRATEKNRSMEAEVRALLEEALRPASRVKLGTKLRVIAEETGGVDLGNLRDATSGEPVEF